MNKFELKQNFENQLKEIDEKIVQIQGELTKAQEYKVKLQGGLETLDLLIKEESHLEIPPNDYQAPEEKNGMPENPNFGKDEASLNNNQEEE